MTSYRTEVTRAGSDREHHWDALRAILMLLGIPYHVALTYRADETWIVNAHEGVPLFAELAHFIHLFRMPAFFLIAGYFGAVLLGRREPRSWLRNRALRLGVPLAMALVTLNPLLNFACELSNFPAGEALRSWAHNSTDSGGYWVRHLWFLIVLLYYSVAAAALVSWFPRLAGKQVALARDRRLARHFVLWWFALAVVIGLWQAVSIELFYMAGLATNGPQQILRLDEALQYLPYFLIGAVLARAPHMRERLYRWSPGILVAAVVFAGLSLLYAKQLWPPYGRFLETMAALCVMQPMLALLRRAAAWPNTVVRSLVDASFVIYLFHLPILAWLVVLFLPMAVPVAIKAFAIMLLTVMLSWGAWEIVSRSPLLRLIYDGIVMRDDKGIGTRPVLAGHSTQSRPMSR